MDSGFIQEKDVEYLNRKRNRRGERSLKRSFRLPPLSRPLHLSAACQKAGAV